MLSLILRIGIFPSVLEVRVQAHLDISFIRQIFLPRIVMLIRGIGLCERLREFLGIRCVLRGVEKSLVRVRGLWVLVGRMRALGISRLLTHF